MDRPVWAGLTESHTAELIASGIDREVAEARGYRTITDKQTLIELGFKNYQARVPGFLVPMYSPGAAASGAGPNAYQFKPDNPRKDRSGRVVKYETRPGATSVIDTHPAIVPLLRDPSVPIFITEGTKKADSGISRGLAVVALQGVWNWKVSAGAEALDMTKDAATAVTPDLDEIPLAGRTVYLVFDSDIVDKKGVRDALKRLGAVLTRRGARVRVLRLPHGPDGEKYGLDDYLVANPGDFNPDRLLDVVLTGVVNGDEDADDGGSDDEFATQADVIKDLARRRYTFGMARNFGPYAVDREGPNVAIPMDRMYELRLFGLYDEKGLGTARTEAVKAAAATLIGRDALQTEEVDNLPVRVAYTDDRRTLVLDMADKSGRAIIVTPDGWRVEPRSPITFHRSAHMRPLPEPVGGGNLFDLTRPFMRTEDEATFQLLTAWSASLAVGWMLHPILYLTGPSGSGKTTMALWAKAIIDPSSAPFQRFQGDPKDNLVAASSAWSFVMDNLGDAEVKSPAFADYLAALVTGAGITARKLFTDSGTVSVHLKRAVLMTSVEELGWQEDLWERIIHVEVPIFTEGRSRLSDLDARFAAHHPAILGAALDLVVLAMRGMPDVDVTGLSRLRFTDFATFLAAVDEAYGTDTLPTYMDNLTATVADRASYSPFVRAVELLLDTSGGRWEGEPLELLQALSSAASMAGLGNALPSSAIELGRVLARESHPLAQRGIGHRRTRVRGRRIITLYRINGGNDPKGQGLMPLGGDGGNDTNGQGLTNGVTQGDGSFSAGNPPSQTFGENDHNRHGLTPMSRNGENDTKIRVTEGDGSPAFGQIQILEVSPRKVNNDRGFPGVGRKVTDLSNPYVPGDDVVKRNKHPDVYIGSEKIRHHPSPSPENPRHHWENGVTDEFFDPSPSATLGRTSVTLSIDARAILDTLSTTEVMTTRTLSEASGRTGARLERPLGYLTDVGLVEKVKRADRPDLEWPKGASSGYVLTGVEWVEAEATADADRGDWGVDPGDLAEWTLLGRDGFAIPCRLCGEPYARPTDVFLTTCPECRTSALS